ncbi:unnamed protein product [Ectocarpus sp. 8 AP-2014]
MLGESALMQTLQQWFNDANGLPYYIYIRGSRVPAIPMADGPLQGRVDGSPGNVQHFNELVSRNRRVGVREDRRLVALRRLREEAAGRPQCMRPWQAIRSSRASDQLSLVLLRQFDVEVLRRPHPDAASLSCG